MPRSRHASAALSLVPLALLVAACPGEGTRSAACGLVQVVGPNIILQQLTENPRQVLNEAPRGLPLDLPIRAEERQFFWPLGRRPDDHPGLSDLGL